MNLNTEFNEFSDVLNTIRDRLPALPRIIGKNEYFNSAVLILLLNIDDEIHILFQKRASHIRQGGEVCFSGGEFDITKDNDYSQTAIRETSEELGIPIHKIELLGSLGTIIAAMGATVDVFVGFTDISMDEMNINHEEVEQIFSIPLNHFFNTSPESYYTAIKVLPRYTDEVTQQEVVLLPSEELGLPERYHKPWGSFKQRVYVYNTEYGIIWGLTARIMFDFIEVTKGI